MESADTASSTHGIESQEGAREAAIRAYHAKIEEFCQDSGATVSLEELDALLTAIEADTADSETIFEVVLPPVAD
ncbi:hypothetical protein ACFR9U_13780 [Halorientalis brevis]|uniref:Uncharacterized protein n=1 Tax=Halorientalis brevis TaxID=1126241 RepID=A0ABD6CFC3_9EURY